MPQEPATLLQNTGVAVNRGIANTTATVGGNGGTRDEAFTLALRESQSILNEPATANGLAQELLPDVGNQLPLEQIISASADGELADDLQVGKADLIEEDVATAFPVQSAIQIRENPEGTSVAPGSDESGLLSLARQVQLRSENDQSIEGAGQDKAIEKVIDRLSGVFTKDNSQAVKDSAENINRAQNFAQRDLAVESMKSEKLSDELLSPRMALDVAKTFMNVSGMTNAENAQSISTLSSGQLLTQQSGDKVLSTLTMDSPLQSKEWREEIGDRVRWLISQKIHIAELKINPPQLGSVEIRINVQNEQVSVQFNTANALVKDTLEESLPRLREILSSSGLDLVDVDVAQHSDSGGRHAENDIEDADSGRTQDNKLSQHDENEMKIDTEAISRQGMIDMYA